MMMMMMMMIRSEVKRAWFVTETRAEPGRAGGVGRGRGSARARSRKPPGGGGARWRRPAPPRGRRRAAPPRRGLPPRCGWARAGAAKVRRKRRDDNDGRCCEMHAEDNGMLIMLKTI